MKTVKKDHKNKNVNPEAIAKYFRYAFIAVIVLMVVTAVLLIVPNLRLFRTYVATVGDEKVSMEEYKYYLSQYKNDIIIKAGNPDAATFWSTVVKDGETWLDKAKKQTLEGIRDIKVQISKAKKQGLKLDKNESKRVEDYISSFVDAYGGAKAADKDMKQNYGVGIADLRDIQRQEMLVQKFIFTQTKDIPVAEDEITAFYENADNSMMFDKVVGRKLLFTYTGKEGTRTMEDSKKLAEAMLARIKAGEDMKTLVIKTSEEEGAPEGEGVYTVQGKYDDQNNILQLKSWSLEHRTGDVDMIETNEGYAIVKIENRERIAIEGVKENIKNELLYNKYEEKLDEWRKDKLFEIKTLSNYETIQ